MISVEIHLQPNGQQVYASYDRSELMNDQTDHSWMTRSYIRDGGLACLQNRKAVTETDLEAILDVCFAKQIERVVIFAEDTLVNVLPNGDGFRITTFDCMTGDVFRNTNVDKGQLRAIVLLCVFSDEHKESATLYPLAEKVLEGCPSSCRPIP